MTETQQLKKMKRALKEYKITGIKTNISFLLRLLDSKEFVSGKYDTQFIESDFLKLEIPDSKVDKTTAAALSLAAILYKQKKKPCAEIKRIYK
jgi:acetyl-CoA carboxylase biotin carboxylase subunit